MVYSPKARFGGQVASCHRLVRRAKNNRNGNCGKDGKKSAATTVVVVVDGNDNDTMTGEEDETPLYPWALISKGGRTMEDDCAI